MSKLSSRTTAKSKRKSDIRDLPEKVSKLGKKQLKDIEKPIKSNVRSLKTKADKKANKDLEDVLDQYEGWSFKYRDAFMRYSNRNSDTYDNAYQSAIKAGIPHGSAIKITTQKWWKRELHRVAILLPKAEDYLNKVMDMDDNSDIVLGDGQVVSLRDTKMIKIKRDTAVDIADRIGKDYGWATRTETLDVTEEQIPQENKVVKAMFGFSAVKSGDDEDLDKSSKK